MKIILLLETFVVLVVVSCSNVPPTELDSSTTNVTDSLTLSKNKGIKNFWIVYRKATKNRVERLWQNAIEDYISALELNSTHKDALYYLGNMYLELSEYNMAQESWNKLLEVNPSSSRAHFQLGKLYLNKKALKQFDLGKAKQKFQKTAEINRDFLQPVLHLAQISLIKNDYKDSSEKLQIVLGSDTKNIEALFLLSYISFKQGDMEKSVIYIKKAKEFSIPNTSTKGVKGEGDTKTGKSMEREISQSIFFEYYKDLEPDKNMEVEVEMQILFTKMNNFILQLQKL